MTSIAYYATETVDAEATARAEAAAGEPCIHIVSEDTTWLAGDIDPHVLAGTRSPALRRLRMQVVDELIDLARTLRGSAALDHMGVDLAEVARYDWYGRLTGVVQRAVALREVLDRGPDTVVWVGPGVPYPTLATVLGARGIRLRHVGGPSTGGRRAPGRIPLRAALRLLAPRTVHPDRHGSVLFAEHFARGAAIASQVAVHLDRHEVLFVTTSGDAYRAAAREAQHVSLTRLASRRARLASLRPRRDLDVLARALASAASGRSIAGLGDSSVMLLDGLSGHTAAAWRTAARFVPLWADVVGRLRPAVMAATTNAPSAVRAAVAASRRLCQAPACFVQHGMLTLHNEAYLDHDRYLVWGERDRRMLLDLGVPTERIVVTGSPELDRVAAFREHELAGSEGELRILYLPSRSGGRFVPVPEAVAMLEAVRAAVADIPGATLTVKVHPGDRSSVFDERPDVEVVRSGDALTRIASSEVVVVSTSTAGFEACALDRPVVVLAPPGVDIPREYASYGAAPLVTDLNGAAVKDAIVQVLGAGPLAERLADGRRRLVTDIFGGARPDAARRIADELRSMSRPTLAGTRP